MSRFSGKRFLIATALLLSVPSVAAAQHAKVMSTNGCGCCVSWVRHLERNGYTAEMKNFPMADLVQKKIEAGLTPDLVSCHTARIEGYIVEGHVPAREVDRLLSERPEAIGLAVPGMPYGSPGMGEPGPDADPFEVLLVRSDGSTEVFASYLDAGE